MTAIIDVRGYRLGIGIVLVNAQGKLFWGQRIGNKDSWQFPQGGILPYETLEQTMFRELSEELGLNSQQVKIMAVSRRWLYYKLPVNLRRLQRPLCIGQKQRWFLLQLTGQDDQICLEQEHPEFKCWRWVDYWYPVNSVIFFKKQIYEQVLREFAPIMQQDV